MAYFMTQIAYTAETWAALVRNPEDRMETAARPIVESLGGRVLGYWMSFGDYDVVIIAETTDNISAAAGAMVSAAGGGVKAVKTTPLMTVEEGMEAMKKAGETAALSNPRAADHQRIQPGLGQGKPLCPFCFFPLEKLPYTPYVSWSAMIMRKSMGNLF